MIKRVWDGTQRKTLSSLKDFPRFWLNLLLLLRLNSIQAFFFFFALALSAKDGRAFAKIYIYIFSILLFPVSLSFCSVTLQLFPLKGEVHFPHLYT